ncbi:MAG: class I SAM-dependent methyltransferase [Lachnospiraceae bacterium]|nr:class I SAM-dependent methyltransferase [Lachnospiraceae bacterium]
MLSNHDFDLWADGYDRSVGISDEVGTYPFAAYRQIMNEIYNRVLARCGKAVLDIGFGTGTLTAKLYEQGCGIWGQDFSRRMMELAREKMPGAKLYQGDFSRGLVEELRQNKYDAIIATYSLHHLTDEQKISLLENLLPLLNDGGTVYIGDVMFETRTELEKHRILLDKEWDDEEIYFVADELARSFPQMRFEPFSFCSGIIEISGGIRNHG